IATVDVDGDGKLDLLTANQSADDISVLLNTGNGVFAAATTVPTGPTPVSLVAGDLNGDGYPDLATTSQATGEVSILLGKAGGAFAAPLAYAVGSPSSLALGDLDGDGKQDLVLVNRGGALVVINRSQ